MQLGNAEENNDILSIGVKKAKLVVINQCHYSTAIQNHHCPYKVLLQVTKDYGFIVSLLRTISDIMLRHGWQLIISKGSLRSIMSFKKTKLPSEA